MRADVLHFYVYLALEFNDEASEKYESMLSPSELERANRFKLSHIRENYILRHGKLRELLANHLHIDQPSAVSIEQIDAHHKPALNPREYDSSLRFNLSKACLPGGSDLSSFLIGFSYGRDIGVDLLSLSDVEKMPRHRNTLEEVCTINELIQFDQLASAHPDQAHLIFGYFFCCKEAVVKLFGLGLSQTKEVEITLGNSLQVTPCSERIKNLLEDSVIELQLFSNKNLLVAIATMKKPEDKIIMVEITQREFTPVHLVEEKEEEEDASENYVFR